MSQDNKPNNEVRHDGRRPASEEASGRRPAADLQKSTSDPRPSHEEIAKGRRPMTEGHRPGESDPNASAGPIAPNPGSGVPPKKP